MVGCANFVSASPAAESCCAPSRYSLPGQDAPHGFHAGGASAGYASDSKSKFVKVTKAWKQILAKTSCGQGESADESNCLESGLANGVCIHELRSVKLTSRMCQPDGMRCSEKIDQQLDVPEVIERKKGSCHVPDRATAQEDSDKLHLHLAKEHNWRIVSDTRPGPGKPIRPSTLRKQSRGPPGNNIDPKELVLEKCVGKGAFGTVYKATLRGETVAVKVIPHSPSQPSIQVAPELELLHGICHPNIVHIQGVFPGMEGFLDDQDSVTCDSRMSLTSGVLSDFARELSDKRGGSNYSSETWVIMGYCDQGSLWDAIKRGDLGIEGSLTSPHYSKVIEVALEVAFAMQHLHEVGIIHGDLKAQNVMLQGSKSSPKNFIAKVGDFGLCRRSPDRNAVTTFSCGTVDHMPPEVLEKGQVSFSTDVFSFAMLLIEMITGDHPFVGMDTPALIMGIVQGVRPKIPQSCPPRLAELVRICWEGDQQKRPTFGVIVGFLKDFMFSSKQSLGPVRSRTPSATKTSKQTKRRVPARPLVGERIDGISAWKKSDLDMNGNLRQRRLLKAWGQYNNIIVNWPSASPDELNSTPTAENYTIFKQELPRFHREQGL